MLSLRIKRLLAERAAVTVFACAMAVQALPVVAKEHPRKPSRAKAAALAASAGAAAQEGLTADGLAEARLMDIYKLAGQGRTREALLRAEALVRQYPQFHLAHLVHGDLLNARSRSLRGMEELASGPGAQNLSELREESRMRLRALRERPPAGHVPAQFVQLSSRNRHAIAVDTSRARLYLFENGPEGLRLLADYYVTVGKYGAGKSVEGDMRTPLGVYHVTSNIDAKKLKDFYGAGALPINYPNPHDARQGKTGSGIWLHGTPPGQFARPPRASDGCLVLANPDLERIIRTVQVRTTPVVIAHGLNWVSSKAPQAPEVKMFTETLTAWREAKTSGDLQRLLSFYTTDMPIDGKAGVDWKPQVSADLEATRGRELELKELSYLRWTDTTDTMVVTFGEVPRGALTGPIKRQYWMRAGRQWKIFFEGVIG